MKDGDHKREELKTSLDKTGAEVHSLKSETATQAQTTAKSLQELRAQHASSQDLLTAKIATLEKQLALASTKEEILPLSKKIQSLTDELQKESRTFSEKVDRLLKEQHYVKHPELEEVRSQLDSRISKVASEAAARPSPGPAPAPGPAPSPSTATPPPSIDSIVEKVIDKLSHSQLPGQVGEKQMAAEVKKQVAALLSDQGQKKVIVDDVVAAVKTQLPPSVDERKLSEEIRKAVIAQLPPPDIKKIVDEVIPKIPQPPSKPSQPMIDEITKIVGREVNSALAHDTDQKKGIDTLKTQMAAMEERVTKTISSLSPSAAPSKEVISQIVSQVKTEVLRGSTDVSEAKITLAVEQALERYFSDWGVQKPDFALSSAGARVILTRSSPSYHAKGFWETLFGGRGGDGIGMPHSVALDSDIQPGNCWAFAGSKGNLTIELSRPSVVVRWTYIISS